MAEERQIVREVVAEWNAVHARNRSVVLLPVSWESHSSPELSGRPQQIINDRLLVHADLLIGIFWTRVGSPTGKAISGSIEEIEEHRQKGKPVMLYFSDVPVVLNSVDQDQYAQLTAFKEWARSEGLIESFGSRDEFRAKFQRQLQIALRDNPYLKDILAQSADAGIEDMRLDVPGRVALSADAREVLVAAAADPQGLVMMMRVQVGTIIQVGQRIFGDAQDRRSTARWEAAILDDAADRGSDDTAGKGCGDF